MSTKVLTQSGTGIQLQDGSGALLKEDPLVALAPDALQVYVGHFALPAANVMSLSVTGIVDAGGTAFTPKAVLFFGTTYGKYESTLNQEQWDIVGLDDGVTHCATAIESRWFVDHPWRGCGGTMHYSILQMQAIFSAGFRCKGYISAFTSGGFTLTFDLNMDGSGTNATGSFGVFGFVAFGGTTLNAKVVRYPTSIVGTTGTVSGVGFQPTGAIFAPGAAVEGAYNDSTGSLLMLGFCDTALNQFAMSATCCDNAEGTAARALIPGYVEASNPGTPPVSQPRTRVTAWTADGFTTNHPLSTGGGAVLLLGGVTTAVGTFTEPATDGAQVVTIPGMLPVGMLFGSVGAPASSATQADESWAVGAFNGVRSWTHWHGMKRGPASSISTNGGANWGDTVALHVGQNNGYYSQPIFEVGTLAGVSFGNENFTGAWTATDGTARQVMYFTWGGPAFTDTGPEPGGACIAGLLP